MNHMIQCDRCREIKEPARFRPGQVSWMKWCLRCERTPTGELPHLQTDADWDHTGDDTK